MGSKTEYTPETLEEWLRNSLPGGMTAESIEVSSVNSEMAHLDTWVDEMMFLTPTSPRDNHM